jgi:uncharacterized membrane protein YdjX (TVP38/TMEM64 family)
MALNSAESKTQFTHKQIALRVALGLMVLAITILLILNRDKVQALQQYGYTGIFLFSVLSNATILFPLPGVVVTTAMGAVFNPFWVAIAAGLGAAVGELSGYLAGVSGQIFLQNRQRTQQVEQWMQKHGSWTILLLAFIPNPLFDLAGFVAGSMKLPLWKFLLLTVVGKIGKMLLFAYLGAGIYSVTQ